MRTQEQFSKILNEVKWWHSFHKKPVWLVALENDYAISVIKPTAKEIAKGTTAILYGVNMEVLDKVQN